LFSPLDGVEMSASLYRFDNLSSSRSFDRFLPRAVAIYQTADMRLRDLPPRLDRFARRLAEGTGDGGSGFFLAC
jgi:hypothetical protein